MTTSLVVAMPAWNEADGISEFICELAGALEAWQPRFVVVDDCSTDSTVDVVRMLVAEGIDITLVINDFNVGHGPTTYRALSIALSLEPDVVLAVDGDGQFHGHDLAFVAEASIRPGIDVVEGVRSNRKEPWFRRIVSRTTQIMVWSRSRRFPQDANTPLRAYKSRFLAEILPGIRENSPIPNLHISALARKRHASIRELCVESRSRRGSHDQGTTWGKAHKSLPSKRFLLFCAKSAREWLQVRD